MVQFVTGWIDRTFAEGGNEETVCGGVVLGMWTRRKCSLAVVSLQYDGFRMLFCVGNGVFLCVACVWTTNCQLVKVFV